MRRGNKGKTPLEENYKQHKTLCNVGVIIRVFTYYVRTFGSLGPLCMVQAMPQAHGNLGVIWICQVP